MEDNSCGKKIEPTQILNYGSWVIKVKVHKDRVISANSRGEVYYYDLINNLEVARLDLGIEATNIIVINNHCLISTNGNLIIETDLDGKIINKLNYSGVWKIYIFDNNYILSDRNGFIYRLDPNFNLVWKIKSDSAWDICIYDKKIYVASTDMSVSVFDYELGIKVWHKEYKHPVYSCTIFNSNLYVGTSEGKIEIIDSNYKIIDELNIPAVRILKSAKCGILAALVNNSVIYLDKNLGIKWEYKTGSWIKDIYCDDNKIFLGSADNYLYVLNYNGKCLSKYMTNGTVFCVDKYNENYVIGSADGNVYIFR